VYTANKPGSFSLSYNVRFNSMQLKFGSIASRADQIMRNLFYEIDPEYTPFQTLMLDVVLNSPNYEHAVEKLKSVKVNAPGYVIVSNSDINSPGPNGVGTIITRYREGTDN